MHLRTTRGDPPWWNRDGFKVPRWCRRREILWAIRLSANDVLQRDIEPLPTRSVGRPANAPVVWSAGFL